MVPEPQDWYAVRSQRGGRTADADSEVPVIAQMRKAVIAYMQSDDFRPQYTVDLQRVKDLFTKEAPKVNMYTNDSPDELKPKLNAKK